MGTRPGAFHELHMTEWSEWVLDHGLPPLPEGVGREGSVPVARWVGPRYAAVMHVQRGGHIDDPGLGELENEVELFVRGDDAWQTCDATGGTNWHDPPFLRPDMEPERVWFFGMLYSPCEGGFACAVDGIAGAAAETIEVEDGDGVTAMAVESPMGAFVVAFDAARPAVIRVRDAEGRVLGAAEVSRYELRVIGPGRP